MRLTGRKQRITCWRLESWKTMFFTIHPLAGNQSKSQVQSFNIPKPSQAWNAHCNHPDPPAFGNNQEKKGPGKEIPQGSSIMRVIDHQ
ncbi:MAG: hypothetical protein HQL81_13185 [Magnetococcales bacterium]|nr:hypothetical protein [Magnetococcales bacterium]